MIEILKGLEEDFKNTSDQSTFIYDNFSFEISKTIECTECHLTKSIIYPLYSLPLAVFGSSNLVGQLQAFFNVQKGMQTCKICGKRTSTTFTEKLLSTPKVCIFHLQKMDRLQKKTYEIVDFPFENLDLTEFQISKKQGATYDLIAVCNHEGRSVRRGHYFSYVKNLCNEKWHCFNDSTVTPVDKNSIKSPENYILIYERKDS